MNKLIVAVPSKTPGGMDAAVDSHFGHCAMYVLVTVEDGLVTAIELLPNFPHQEGGCLAPVQYLADKGISAIISGGMGMRPFMGFQQAGIQVWLGSNHPTVGEAVNALLHGKLQPFSLEYTCGGSQNPGHHSCGGHSA